MQRVGFFGILLCASVSALRSGRVEQSHTVHVHVIANELLTWECSAFSPGLHRPISGKLPQLVCLHMYLCCMCQVCVHSLCLMCKLVQLSTHSPPCRYQTLSLIWQALPVATSSSPSGPSSGPHSLARLSSRCTCRWIQLKLCV